MGVWVSKLVLNKLSTFFVFLEFVEMKQLVGVLQLDYLKFEEDKIVSSFLTSK